MKFAIICSNKDQAGLTIKKSLIDLFRFEKTDELFENNPVFTFNNTKLYTANQDSVYCEDIDKKIQADLFIFATKHESRNSIPSLSVHTQGNWYKAEFGGRDSQLCIGPANFLKTALIKLTELAKNLDFEIIQECTHHGPYLEKPSMFIEIGSSEEQWVRKDAAKIIAQTIIHLTESTIPIHKTAVGLGGLHHTPSFKKIIVNSDIAIGHVCPKYMLEHLNAEILQQAIERTWPKAEMIILDYKGLGKHKEHVKDILKNFSLEIKRTKEF
ncbi:MAG: D-aminoacyl-tRNA deacylase [Candidatus Woesearchaeota archaeon]